MTTSSGIHDSPAHYAVLLIIGSAHSSVTSNQSRSQRVDP
jgi:hypothetical protein